VHASCWPKSRTRWHHFTVARSSCCNSCSDSSLATPRSSSRALSASNVPSTSFLSASSPPGRGDPPEEDEELAGKASSDALAGTEDAGVGAAAAEARATRCTEGAATANKDADGAASNASSNSLSVCSIESTSPRRWWWCRCASEDDELEEWDPFGGAPDSRGCLPWVLPPRRLRGRLPLLSLSLPLSLPLLLLLLLAAELRTWVDAESSDAVL